MKSFAIRSFWLGYLHLPDEVKQRAKKQYLLWQQNPKHPSLHFKKIGGNLWSARVSDHYRALSLKKGEDYYWFWIGVHWEYERIIKGHL